MDNITKLIQGKYYYFYNKSINTWYYFKFNYLSGNEIFGYGFIIKFDRNEKWLYNQNDTYYVYPLEWFIHSNGKELEDFSLIVDHLPDNNIDKKYYLRKEKIKWLLKL